MCVGGAEPCKKGWDREQQHRREGALLVSRGFGSEILRRVTTP